MASSMISRVLLGIVAETEDTADYNSPELIINWLLIQTSTAIPGKIASVARNATPDAMIDTWSALNFEPAFSTTFCQAPNVHNPDGRLAIASSPQSGEPIMAPHRSST